MPRSRLAKIQFAGMLFFCAMKKTNPKLKRCTFLKGLQFCGLVIVPITISEKTRYFLLDTGSQRNGVSDADTETMAAFRQNEGQLLETQGLDGHTCVTPFGRLTYMIAEHPFEVDCFVISGKTFESLNKELGYEISGLMGVEFMRKHNCIIDFAKGVVTVDVSEEHTKTDSTNIEFAK